MTATTLRTLLAVTFSFACVGTMEPGPTPTPGPGTGGGGGSDDVSGGGDDTMQGGGDETFDVCPAGEDAIYHPAPEISGSGFTSGVRTGSGGTPMIVTCGTTSCADGQVGVETMENPIFDTAGGISCVAAPPACADGTSPFWVNSVMDPEDPLQEVGGFWTCSAACSVIVDFGGLYGFQSACAGAPPDCAGSGDTATFEFESQQWQCLPMCDGGLYDPVEFEGTTVCVPC